MRTPHSYLLAQLETAPERVRFEFSLLLSLGEPVLNIHSHKHRETHGSAQGMVEVEIHQHQAAQAVKDRKTFSPRISVALIPASA
jgi:hypothetical protein